MIEQDYEVRVSYEGGIMLSATSTEEALTKAKEIMLEETNPDMAKYLDYKVEVFKQDDKSNTIKDLVKREKESNA